MKVDKLIEELNRVRKEHGNIEVTCTGSLLPDGYRLYADGSYSPADVFETTVEKLIVNEFHPRHEKAVRLFSQSKNKLVQKS